ncbi:MAG: lipocalin family protein [Methylococcaceae bacterium]
MIKENKTRRRKHKKRHLLRKHWVIALVISLLIIIGAGLYHEIDNSKAAPVWSETKTTSNTLITLPKDDAPHPSKMEGWYYSGQLVSASGKKYSFHDTVFLINSSSLMVNHLSFVDYQSGRRYIDQLSSAGNLSVGTANGFNFTGTGWRMSGSNDTDTLQASTADFSFNLGLNNTQPPVFHGLKGVLDLGSAGSSYYYSRTRMTISGTVTIKGKTEAVSGIAWFDHQWGDFSSTQLSWDWFSLQLDNHSDIMIYQLRDKFNKPILYTGSFTENGKTEILASKDFSLSKGKKWLSSKTGTSYPVEWQIKIPAKKVDITTQSQRNDSEFDATLTTYNVYWEGAVQVTGSHTGQGFMELSGYRNSKAD